jgi:predicted dehydrogenase
MEPVKVGLMGLGRGGRALAEVLLASTWCKLTAVGSVHSKGIEQFQAQYPGIAVHNDFRSLIVSSPLDALFVAVPPYLRGNYLPMAADRHLPVFMLTPAARRFDEALAAVGAFEAADCPIIVSRAWGIEPALQPDALGLEEGDKFFLARGNVTLCLEENLEWRGDSQAAGGGVLLDQAYGLIDILVQTMGIPSTVYATIADIARPGTRFPYDTEDTAAVICRYSNGTLATITACWAAGPADWSMHLYGTSGSVHIDANHAVLTDRSGQSELGRHARPANPLALQVDEFLSTLRSNPRNLRGTLRQHLPVVATIQAAYLSARTGQPESPGTIFKMHNVKEPAPTRLK